MSIDPASDQPTPPGASDRPLVSVIVVNHNRARLLRGCLRSLLSQDYEPLEILVVDNASQDGSRDVVESFPDPRIRLINQESNLGFAAANNRAIETAKGEFVALLNNDAEADRSWISSLAACLSREPEVGMCASKILFYGTNTIDKAGHLIYLDGQNRGRGTGEVDRGQYDSSSQALLPDGCAALYRRSLLVDLDGFDEDFFAYADDADLGLRARWLGWECRYVPGAIVRHHHSSTSGRFSAQKVFWVERNRHWLALKNLPWPLLLVLPLTTPYRWAWNVVAALSNRGTAGRFRESASFGRLAITIVRAQLAGLAGTLRMWRKRRALRPRRRLSSREFLELLFRFRISARELAFKEHGGDRAGAPPSRKTDQGA